MNLVQRTILVFTDLVVRLTPGALLRSLAVSISRLRPDTLIHTVATAKRSLDPSRLPARIQSFGDLAFLFWLTPINRGILRQDFDEAALLYKTIVELDPQRGVEIGRYAGGSTILIASAFKKPGAKLTSIDLGPRADDELSATLEHLGLRDRVELEVRDSGDVSLKDGLDFLFIDGDHSYAGAKRDHLDCGKHVRPGGLIIHHDMANSRDHATSIPELYQLRQDILSHQSSEIELVSESGSMTVFRRTESSWTRF